MSLLWRAVHVHRPYSYGLMRKGACYNASQRSMHIYIGEVPLQDIELRVQGAGGVQGELAMLRVYVEF